MVAHLQLGEFLFPELEEEAERASTVKRRTPILVILGNPPYNRFVGVAEDEEANLIEPYNWTFADSQLALER